METSKRSDFLNKGPLARVAGFSSWFAPLLVAMLWVSGHLAAAQKAKPAAKALARPDPALLQARSRVLGARPLGMYYYFPDTLALDSLQAHAGEMTLLGPQCFFVDTAGIVHGEIPAPVMEFARQANVPVMPLLVNPGFNRAIAHGLLSNPQAQERAAAYLAYLAKRDNYVGWQLDLEYLAPADKRRYARFVARVAARLHRDRRLLSVAVVPRFSDAYPDKRSAEFRTGEWGAPFDFRALGRAADFLALMTYDQHSSASPPGPVAGYAWVRAALDYAVRRVPRSKLLLGIPFYGREWVATPQGTTSNSLAFKDVKPLLDKLHDITPLARALAHHLVPIWGGNGPAHGVVRRQPEPAGKADARAVVPPARLRRLAPGG